MGPVDTIVTLRPWPDCHVLVTALAMPSTARCVLLFEPRRDCTSSLSELGNPSTPPKPWQTKLAEYEEEKGLIQAGVHQRRESLDPLWLVEGVALLHRGRLRRLVELQKRGDTALHFCECSPRSHYRAPRGGCNKPECCLAGGECG